MRVEALETTAHGDRVKVTARVTSPAWSESRDLWIDVPGEFAGEGLTAGDPWVAALLLPAMRLGEPLHIEAPVSNELLVGTEQLATIYATGLSSVRPVEVSGCGPRTGMVRNDNVGLFFSCGVDSFYSLLKSIDRRLVGRESEITHLVNIHGFDIDVGAWKSDVVDAMVENTARVADQFGLTGTSIATNLRRFYSSSGLSWHWGQMGALAALALVLQDDFRQFRIAAGYTPSEQTMLPSEQFAASHVVLTPLYSTSRCSLVVDGAEAERHDKVRRVAQSSIALQTLRVCIASHQPGYNCGRCAKCVGTMIDLTLLDALEACSTLPHEFDIVSLTTVSDPLDEVALHERLCRRLEARGLHGEVVQAFRVGIARMRQGAEQKRRGVDTIRAAVAPDRPLALLDEDEIRWDLARSHTGVRPFPEAGGHFNGLPADDADAIDELRRIRRAGIDRFVIWRNDFWVLDHYAVFAEVLRTECSVVESTPDVVIYAMSES